MEKNQKNQKAVMATKTLASCALLAAMNVILARFLGFMPNEGMRISIEAVPTFLAGLLFGPLAGAMVGFAGDFIGTLFTPYGYNPIYCIPPLLYGLFGGFFAPFLRKKMTLLRVGFAMLIPVALGSVLIQSAVISFMQFASFWGGFALKLTERSIQFAITLVVETTVLYLLFKSRVFERLGLWQQQ